ncbi:hypothetical protein [Micromonospora echinospora]|uniref:hypothetical protein n=1 Tax=Micromonospora echinospora TaxID=1877 RepID=UPI003A87844C
MKALSPTAAAYVPEGIRLDLRQALFALTGNGTRTGYLFGVEVAATLDLGRLPVVGDHLRGTTMGVDPLRLLAATAALPAAEAAALAALLPAGFTLPAGDLAAGFTVDATLLLGPFTQALAVPVGGPRGCRPHRPPAAPRRYGPATTPPGSPCSVPSGPCTSPGPAWRGGSPPAGSPGSPCCWTPRSPWPG